MESLLRAIGADPVFHRTTAPYVVVDRDLVIRAVNPAYLRATGRERDELVGSYLFDAFPDNPALPDADGVRNLNASLESVLRRGKRHRMRVQRYDVPGPSEDDDFVLKYWAAVNTPLPDESGRTAGVLHHVEDVTAVWGRLSQLDRAHLREALGDAGEDGPSLYAKALAHQELAGAEAMAEVAQLREALTSRVVIEQAKGIIAARRGCTPDAAFDWLRRRARDTRVKLHDVCAAVVANTGQHEDEAEPAE